MTRDFEGGYKKLNEAQKTAVDNIDGPLLVIAGPGTGKTQLLSLRVANILKETDSIAENILCLTFTDSAVNEMRKRLHSIIGRDAYSVTISTYHSFGSDLIRSYPTYFPNYGALNPATDLDIDSIVRKIQSKLAYSNAYKNELFISDIKHLISDSKQALLTPDDLMAVARDNIAFIAKVSKVTASLSDVLARISKKSADDFNKLIITNKETSVSAHLDKVEPLAAVWNRELEEAINDYAITSKTTALSKWKLKYLSRDNSNLLIAAGKDQNEKLIAFSGIYRSYQDELEKQNLYDYDDMILRSINALESSPELRYSLQEKYLYILLDEYQDTNAAQAKLVSLLSDNPVNENRPNIMAVGDDDQAIYAFQGAKHSHMIDFLNSYTDVKLVSLKENYRSTQDLIGFSSSIAEQIESRLISNLKDISKKFTSARKESPSTKIERLNFKTEIEEYVWIAKNIKKSQESGEPLSEIAILSPKHQYLEAMATYLQAENVPITYERRENILQDRVIEQLINICRLIKAINDQNTQLVNSLLATVLNYEFFEIPTEIIWQTSWQAHEERKPWLNVILSKPETKLIGLFLTKLAYNAKSLKFDYIIDQIIGLSEVIIYDKKSSSYKSPFYNFYKSDDPKSDILFSEILSNLVIIRSKFKDYKVEPLKPLLVPDFIDFVDGLIAAKIKILNTSPYSESEDSVKLMTAYKAKGQEFDNVYILSAINEVWGSSARNASSKISLPPNLKYIRNATNDDDNKLRLLYVALTRARNNIYLSSYSSDLSGKPSSSLKYLNELEDGSHSDPGSPEKAQIIVKDHKELLDSSNIVSDWQNDYKPLELKHDLVQLLKPRLETYQLSPTELNSFLDVRNAGPINFYNRYILRYPSPVTEVVDYGSAVHESLDWLQKQLASSKKMPSLDKLLSEFEVRLKNRRLSEDEYQNLYERGRLALGEYYSKATKDFKSDDISEYSFKNEAVFVGKAHLNGNIDKLVVDNENRQIEIVDYKTGKSYNRWSSEAKLHLYSNQLYFYKLLVEGSNRFKKYTVERACLDFVEPDTSGSLNKLYIEFDDKRMEVFKQLIDTVWQHIQDLNFPDISRYGTDLKGIRKFEDDLISGDI
jgi:DNA helicase-2/ATP-dependent DNA helicase PcrA